MDPLYEQELTAEVIFLHSLWHQGPPRPAVADHPHPHPVQATPIKNVRKRKRRKNSPHNTEPNSSPGLPWPVPPPPPPAGACPTFESKPNPNPKKLSSRERFKLAAKNAHHNALEILVAFFGSNKNSNSDSDSDSVDSISDEDDDSIDEDKCGFFYKTFEEDTKMRDYYKKSFAKGEFTCLVCGSLEGKKTRKKFNGCVALVQHSITTTKTNRRKAHRAFGEAVCKVLGWDISNLSSIASSLSNNPKETLVRSC